MSQAADDLFHGAGGSARAAAVKKRSVSGQAHSGCMTVMSFAPQQGQPSMVYGNSSALWIGQHHVSLTVFQHRKALQNVGEDRHESHAVGSLVDWGCKEVTRWSREISIVQGQTEPGDKTGLVFNNAAVATDKLPCPYKPPPCPMQADASQTVKAHQARVGQGMGKQTARRSTTRPRPGAASTRAR